jgi:hypothetical protein
MSKLRFLFLFAMILQLPFTSIGQFSHQQAIDLVLNKILVADTGHINVYSSDTTIDTSTLILKYNRTIALPYASNWVFLSDDNPFASWSHSCRYVIVNSSNGDYTIDTSNLCPVNLQTGYEAILLRPILPPLGFPCANSIPTHASPNPHLHAVLICGYDVDRYNTDIATVYNMLREAGYSKDNITVLYGLGYSSGTASWGGDFDGEGPSDINDSATFLTLNNTFSTLTGTLGAEDQLFVYVTGEGGQDAMQQIPSVIFLSAVVGENPEYTTTNFVSAVQNIACAQMIIVMEPCFSGGFISPLINDPNALCKNRIVQTATDAISPSYAEEYLTGGHIDEFTFYWSAAARGHYPTDRPWMWGCPVGDFPFTTWNPSIWGSLPHAADYNPDSGDPSAYFSIPPVQPGNSDGYTQFIEAFNYADCMDSYSAYGYYNPYQSWGTENPSNGINNGFSVDDLFCLNGIAGNTSINLTSPQIVAGRSYLLGGQLNVLSDMNISGSAELTMGVDNSIIDVGQNSQFKVLGQNVRFNGNGISIYSNNGLLIENQNNSLDLNNVTFTSAFLQNYGSILTIEHLSTFNNCSIIASNRGAVTIVNSAFNNSPIALYNQDQSSNSTAQVNNCTMNGNNYPGNGIFIEDYENFSISNNNISNAEYNGIGLYFCGIGGTGNQLVQNNQIYNCGQSGVDVYGSIVKVTMNHIYNNQFGIEMLDNNSETSLTGDENAQDYSGTQEINDCSYIDIYATTSCFPYYVRFNAINNDNTRNNQNPYVYYDDKCFNYAPLLDVRQNCWGNRFNPTTDLYANCGPGTYGYEYIPTWCPSNGGNVQINPDEEMFNTGMSDDSIGDYTDAKSVFQLLVETYPNSEYTPAAMKELFAIEPYAGDNFSGLKTYYLTNDSILADTALAELSGFLANDCNIQLQDWSDAIAWYENQIQNPVSATDSLFAVIDLGHLYLIMDSTGQKSTIIGSMIQYKPKSRAKYVKYRDSLIALLPFPKDPLTKSINKLQNGQLLQNVPNPATSSTDIYFKLFSATNAEIKIYDSWGILKQEIPITDLMDGTHKISFNTSILPAGVYEYSLYINERMTATKKMVVIR